MERLLTTEEVAEGLRVEAVTVRRLVGRGELSAYRVGGEYRFKLSDIDDYLARQRIGDGKEPQNVDKFTERSRKVLTLAQQEAIRFNHNCIGTEHLLLGLMLEGANIAAEVLSGVGVELSDARDAVAQIIDGHNERVAGREISFAPRATKTIALANDEAFRLGHDYVAPEHLLLALLHEGTQGIMGGVLIALGMDPEHVRAHTMEAVTTT